MSEDGKFTKGPISVSGYSSVVGCALTVQPDPAKNSYLIGSAIGPKEEALANARLWAAAPDMFEATRKGLILIEREREVLEKSFLPEPTGVEEALLNAYEETIVQMRAALTKALTGR